MNYNKDEFQRKRDINELDILEEDNNEEMEVNDVELDSDNDTPYLDDIVYHDSAASQMTVVNDLEYIASFATPTSAAGSSLPLATTPHLVMDVPLDESDEDDDDDSTDSDRKGENIGDENSEEEDDENVDLQELMTKPIEELEKKNTAGKKGKARPQPFLTEEEEDGTSLFENEPPRTKNEIANSEDIEKIITNPSIPQAIRIEDLNSNDSNSKRPVLTKVGEVLYQMIHENTIIIQSYLTNTPLNEGSIICNQQGIILGLIYEIFGPVLTPFYVVRYKNPFPVDSRKKKDLDSEIIPLVAYESDGDNNDNMDEEGKEENKIESKAEEYEKIDLVGLFQPNTTVYTTPSHASFITPILLATLKVKGSDASNAYDEEPPEDELEYSDDEEEMLAKQAKKKQAQTEKRQNQLLTHSGDQIPPGIRVNKKPKSQPPSKPQPKNYSNSTVSSNQPSFGAYANPGYNPYTNLPNPPAAMINNSMNAMGMGTDATSVAVALSEANHYKAQNQLLQQQLLMLQQQQQFQQYQMYYGQPQVQPQLGIPLTASLPAYNMMLSTPLGAAGAGMPQYQYQPMQYNAPPIPPNGSIGHKSADANSKK
jgi:rRNA processing protein Gar1